MFPSGSIGRSGADNAVSIMPTPNLPPKGGEGKSRIGLLLKKLFGEASHSESILRIETNRFASANLEYKLVMVDDDLNMVTLPETRNIKSIVTAEDCLCIERKNKQAVQGLLYVRFICFGNGNLVAAHDNSDGFWRRQILTTVKDRDPVRVCGQYALPCMVRPSIWHCLRCAGVPGALKWTAAHRRGIQPPVCPARSFPQPSKKQKRPIPPSQNDTHPIVQVSKNSENTKSPPFRA